MNRQKLILSLRVLLPVLLALGLAVEALLILRGGLAARAAGDLTVPIYTRQKVGAALLRQAPLALAALAAFLIPCAPVKEKRGDCDADMPPKKAEPGRALRLALLALAITLLAAGVWNGSMRDVLYKAVKICTECVGLG